METSYSEGVHYNQCAFERPCSECLFCNGAIETAIQVTFGCGCAWL